MPTTHKPCPVCGSDALEPLVTYKHIWTQCNDCGNVTRERRERYLLSGPLFARTLSAISRGTGNRLAFVLRDFLRDEAVVESQEHYYNYYSRIVASGDARWSGEFAAVTRELAALGIDCAGKHVLDISGGPGFFAKEMSAVAARSVVTEFSPVATEAMQQHLGIEAIKFDYNSDSLRSVVRGKFDVVFLRSSINFCRDLPRLVAELAEILRPGAVIYVSFVTPSLGCVLNWQFDEYTYEVLYQSETLQRHFAAGGMQLITPPRYEKYNPYTHYGSGGRHDPDGNYVPPANLGSRLYANAQYLCRTPFVLAYGLPAIAPTRNFNRELVQKPCFHIYRWQGRPTAELSDHDAPAPTAAS